MTSDRAFRLLERENPVSEDDLPTAEDTGARLLRERILLEEAPQGPRTVQRRAQRRLGRVSAAGVALAVATAAAALLLVGSPGDGPAVENARAAIKKAAAVTAASAKHSGTAVVRITHDDELWAQTTIRWNGADLAVSRDATDAPRRPGRPESVLLLVDGLMYGVEPEAGGWVVLGPPSSIDPGSGTTPAEYLAATREDVGGVTLRRLTDAMTGLTTRKLADGSTVYSGSVAAGLIARESGLKEGQSIRVLPFGYVARDEAADPSAAVDAAVTVGADGIVRGVSATWGTGSSVWKYEVAYSGLGATPGPVAPADARPLRDRLRAGE
jgi:hypothetical protein